MIFDELVVPTRVFSSWSGDHSRLFSTEPLAWHDSVSSSSSNASAAAAAVTSVSRVGHLGADHAVGWCTWNPTSQSENKLRDKFTRDLAPDPVFVFARIMYAVCEVFRAAESDRFAEATDLPNAAGTGSVPIDKLHAVCNAQLDRAVKWADKNLTRVAEVYERGVTQQQRLASSSPSSSVSTAAASAASSSLAPARRAVGSTFSASHVLLDMFRRRDAGAVRDQLPVLDLSTMHCKNVVVAVGALLDLGSATKGWCGLQSPESRPASSKPPPPPPSSSSSSSSSSSFACSHPVVLGANTSRALRAMVAAHWEQIRWKSAGNDRLHECLNTRRNPYVPHAKKREAFRNALVYSRNGIFVGRSATIEVSLELRVNRSIIIPTSMSEISKALRLRPFPFYRRPIAVESSSDQNVRVTFLGEQGAGPGVTRGWFSACARAITLLEGKFTRRVMGGGAELGCVPLAPVYFERTNEGSAMGRMCTIVKASCQLVTGDAAGALARALGLVKLGWKPGNIARDGRTGKVIAESEQPDGKIVYGVRISSGFGVVMIDSSGVVMAETGKAFQAPRVMGSQSTTSGGGDGAATPAAAKRRKLAGGSVVSGNVPLPSGRAASETISDREYRLVIETFSFVGRFLGLALSCDERVPVSLAPHVSRYLMGQDPELSDLQAFDPDMYKQLTELLRMKRIGE